MKRDFICAAVNRAFKQFSLQSNRARDLSIKQRGCANRVIQQLHILYCFQKKTFDDDSPCKVVFVNQIDRGLSQRERFVRRTFQFDVEKGTVVLEELEDIRKRW